MGMQCQEWVKKLKKDYKKVKDNLNEARNISPQASQDFPTYLYWFSGYCCYLGYSFVTHLSWKVPSPCLHHNQMIEMNQGLSQVYLMVCLHI